MKLNIGSGREYMEGWINLDNNNFYKVDLLYDITKIPFPFKANLFSNILLSHVLEHMDNSVELLQEMWRLSKSGGLIEIRVPYWNHYGAWGDITHRRGYSGMTFDMFRKGTPLYDHKYYNVDMDFELIEVTYGKHKGFLGWLINRNRKLTEHFLSKFIPIFEVKFVLKVLK